MSSPPVAPDPGDGYGQAIAAELERHGILQISGEDFQRIQAWYEDGVPEWLAVQTIAAVHHRLSAMAFRLQKPTPAIRRPLRYYEPAVLEAAAELRELEAPGARQLPEPCDTFKLHAAPGRPCLNCGWRETAHA